MGLRHIAQVCSWHDAFMIATVLAENSRLGALAIASEDEYANGNGFTHAIPTCPEEFGQTAALLAETEVAFRNKYPRATRFHLWHGKDALKKPEEAALVDNLFVIVYC